HALPPPATGSPTPSTAVLPGRVTVFPADRLSARALLLYTHLADRRTPSHSRTKGHEYFSRCPPTFAPSLGGSGAGGLGPGVRPRRRGVFLGRAREALRRFPVAAVQRQPRARQPARDRGDSGAGGEGVLRFAAGVDGGAGGAGRGAGVACLLHRRVPARRRCSHSG